MASGGGQWIRELLAQSIVRLREKMEGQEVLRQEEGRVDCEQSMKIKQEEVRVKMVVG